MKSLFRRLRHIVVVVILSLFFQNFILGFFGGNPIPQPIPEVNVDQYGKAGFSVPIAIPSGTKGMNPQLSLFYHSGSGNGVLGVGWQLDGLHSISIDPSFPVTYSSSDRYISSMGGRLSYVGEDEGYHSYRESFMRYFPQGSCGNGAPCSWIAIDKNGTKFTFGSTADSKFNALGKANAKSWLVNRVEDVYGNHYDVSYTYDTEFGYTYTSQITYNNVAIQLFHENRKDQIPDYGFGAKIQSQKRMNKIRVQVDGNTIREYDLSYEYGITSSQSRLIRIKRSGSNDNGSEDFQDLQFTYSEVSTGIKSMNSGTGVSFGYKMTVPVNHYIDAYVSLAKQFGGQYETIAWHLCSGSSYYVKNPSGSPCAPQQPQKMYGFFPMDMNGDGKTDFAYLTDAGSNEFFKTFSLGVYYNLAEPHVTTAKFLGSIPISYNSFKSIADIDGDGKTDFLFGGLTDGKLNVAFSNGNGFNTPVVMSNVNLDVPDTSTTSIPVLCPRPRKIILPTWGLIISRM